MKATCKPTTIQSDLNLLAELARSQGYSQAISDVLWALANEGATWDHLWTAKNERRDKLDPHTLVTILERVQALAKKRAEAE